MLSVSCAEVALDPVKVREGATVEDVLKVLKPDAPVFVIGEKVGVVDRNAIGRMGRDEKVSRFAVWVDPLEGDEPVYRAAQVMVEKGVYSIPVNVDGEIKGITEKVVLGALRSTKELARREARTVASFVPAINEKRIHNIENVARKNGINVIPVVNDERKLIGVWIDGKLVRRPSIVREGTRLRLVVDKVLRNPVVVIDKRREPVGVVTVDDLLDLAASYREFNVPSFYSGLELLSPMDRGFVKEMVEKTLRKIVKSVNVFYLSFHIKKTGMWRVKIKISTPLRTFMVTREGVESLLTIKEALKVIESEVMEEKQKRVEWKKMARE